MTPTTLAARLNGREYCNEISSEESSDAKAAGLVVIFGASDDLMEFRGAISDELGAWGGKTAHVTGAGLLPPWDSLELPSEGDAEAYFAKKRAGFAEIEALWCAEPGLSWTYRTEIPHATFEILEDGEPYCRGIVFALADVARQAPTDDTPVSSALLAVCANAVNRGPKESTE